jgi:hypothetical protein
VEELVSTLSPFVARHFAGNGRCSLVPLTRGSATVGHCRQSTRNPYAPRTLFPSSKPALGAYTFTEEPSAP